MQQKRGYWILNRTTKAQHVAKIFVSDSLLVGEIVLGPSCCFQIQEHIWYHSEERCLSRLPHQRAERWQKNGVAPGDSIYQGGSSTSWQLNSSGFACRGETVFYWWVPWLQILTMSLVLGAVVRGRALCSSGAEEHLCARGGCACITRGRQFSFAKSFKVLKLLFIFFLVRPGAESALKKIKKN